MFSGIVEELGRIDSVDAVAGRIRVDCGESIRGSRRGDSIAVSGCCLTLTDFISGGFVADVMPETFARTTLGSRTPGDPVTGHVDGVGIVAATRVEGNATWMTIAPPAALLTLLVEKGCVAIDGISLTVVAVDADSFTVSLIPHTLQHTIAGGWVVGSAVNLEGDLIAKYVMRGIAAHLAAARPLAFAAKD